MTAVLPIVTHGLSHTHVQSTDLSRFEVQKSRVREQNVKGGETPCLTRSSESLRNAGIISSLPRNSCVCHGTVTIENAVELQPALYETLDITPWRLHVLRAH